MSILIRYFFNKRVVLNSSLKLPLFSSGLTKILHPSLSIMAALNCHNNAMSTLKDNRAHSLSEVQNGDRSITDNNEDYESAVLKLHSLVSNAEVLASIRANTREHRHMTHIGNINKFILRSGITEEEIDKMSIIHVSGTKGKGSTCAFCERILNSKGYKTGLFTSPHLVEVRERIRINGRPVSKEVYAHHFWKVYNRLIQTQKDKDEKLPAYFAFNMIISFHIFLSEGVDVSIIEVGIGGQYDSTNFIRRPVVCGVTSLGYDHVSILGNTIEQIAWNKAGIFKAGSPAIVVSQPLSAMQVILDRAKERQSALYLSEPIDQSVLDKDCIKLGISGKKQADNAGLAVQLVRMWEQRQKAKRETMPCNVSGLLNTDGIPVLQTTNIDNLTAKGLSSCVWPGRAQVVTRPEMSVTYYLDGAHTKESVQVCSEWFKEKADEEMKSLKGKVVRVLIFNVTGERKPGPLLECLKECHFDAAGFCTNSVSTVDSFNKKDQINPMYTSTVMVQKTEENKMCWDQLHSNEVQTPSSPSSNLPDLSTVRTGPSKRLSETDDSCTVEGVPIKKKIIDVSPPPPSSSSASPKINKVNGAANHQNNKFHENESSFSPLDVNSDRTPDTHQTSHENNKGVDGNLSASCPNNDHLEENNNNIDRPKVHHNHHSTVNNCSYTLMEDRNNCCHIHMSDSGGGKQQTVPMEFSLNSDRVKGCTDSHDSKIPPPQSSPVLTSSSPSQCFPCVLQALVWATQGKDRSISVIDGTIALPPTPQGLADADHIQVLVTGSLLLVGGVLGVIDPNMNE